MTYWLPYEMLNTPFRVGRMVWNQTHQRPSKASCELSTLAKFEFKIAAPQFCMFFSFHDCSLESHITTKKYLQITWATTRLAPV